MIFDKDWVRTFILDRMFELLNSTGIEIEKEQLRNIFCPNVETNDPDIIEIRGIFEILVRDIHKGIQDKLLVVWNTVNKLNPIPYLPRLITTASSIIYETNKWKRNMNDLQELTDKLTGVVSKITNVSETVNSLTDITGNNSLTDITGNNSLTDITGTTAISNTGTNDATSNTGTNDTTATSNTGTNEDTNDDTATSNTSTNDNTGIIDAGITDAGITDATSNILRSSSNISNNFLSNQKDKMKNRSYEELNKRKNNNITDMYKNSMLSPKQHVLQRTQAGGNTLTDYKNAIRDAEKQREAALRQQEKNYALEEKRAKKLMSSMDNARNFLYPRGDDSGLITTRVGGHKKYKKTIRRNKKTIRRNKKTIRRNKKKYNTKKR